MVVSFQYLLGEDADSVDQFQVLAHPKVHIIISLDISMQVQCMWIFNGVNNRVEHGGNNPYIAKSRPRKNQSGCSDLPEDLLTI